jgi:hypothetical protein
LRTRTVLGWSVVAGALVTATACESIPDFTFADADAAADASSDAAIADAKASDANGVDAAKSTDAGHDGGVDAGSPYDASACGGGIGDICCGTEICRGCAQSDCAQCTSLGCGSTDICCSKGVSNVICKASGQGC